MANSSSNRTTFGTPEWIDASKVDQSKLADRSQALICIDMDNVNRVEWINNSQLGWSASLYDPFKNCTVSNYPLSLLSLNGGERLLVFSLPEEKTDLYEFKNHGRPVPLSFDTLSNGTTNFDGVSFVLLNENVYIIGGFHRAERYSKYIQKYDIVNNEWDKVKGMHKPRAHAASIAYGGKIYVAGGRSDPDVLSDFECFDPAANQWKSLPPMKTPRSNFTLAYYQGRLFAIGGFGQGEGYPAINLVESYNLDTGVWESEPKLITARAYHNSIVINDQLFIVGGSNNNIAFSSTERLVIENGARVEWREDARLNQPSACPYLFIAEPQYSPPFTGRLP